VFNNDNNKEIYLDHQIRILECFLKDCVTLKIEVMAAENPSLLSLMSHHSQQHKCCYCFNLTVAHLQIHMSSLPHYQC